MSKITRPDSIVHFAEDFQTNEMTIYGEVNYPVLDNMVQMVNAEYYRGWGINDPLINPNPYIQDFNAFAYTMSLYNGYVFQEGFVDYNTSQTYYKNAITKYNGEAYISLIENNKGNLPTNTSGNANFVLTGSQPENIENGSKLLSIGNGYMVRYKTSGTNGFVLYQFNTGGTYTVVGSTPVEFQSVNMYLTRITDTIFAFTSSSSFYIYEVDLINGVFTQLNTKLLSVLIENFSISKMPSYDGNIRFVTSNITDTGDTKVWQYDISSNNITDITFAFTPPALYMDAEMVNESENKIVVFDRNFDLQIYTFDVNGFTAIGTIQSEIGELDIVSILRPLDDNVFMIYDGSTIANDFIRILGIDESNNILELQVIDVGGSSGRRSYASPNTTTITVLDNVGDSINTYTGGIQLAAWRRQRADELAFDGNDDGFESNNVSDAIKELLEKILPVGKVVHFATDDDPNTIYPIGVWEEIEGKFLVGQDVSDPNFDTIGETGGSFEFTVSRDGWGSLYYGSSPTTEGRLITGTGDSESTETWQSFGEAQNDQTVLYAPPYRVVKIWKRVS